jgi:hypothetical protein
MTATTVPKRRINVTFPEPLLEIMEAIIPPRERNGFIVEATERALRQERLLKAIETSSGAWSDTDHPDLTTDEDIDRYVRRLRDSWMPHPREEPAEQEDT